MLHLPGNNAEFLRYCFLNGRFIRSNVICRALEEGYKEYLMQHKFPLVVLKLTVNTTKVDINVHPTKMDIKFGNSEDLLKLVSDTIKNRLANINLIPRVETPKVEKVKVDMGEPILEAMNVPINSENEKVLDESIDVDGNTYYITGVSMGNPHAVTFLDDRFPLGKDTDIETMDLETIGPKFEFHERFPKRINAEFVKVIDRNNVRMRVWERGTGETLCCGTGCCATAVACILNGLTDNTVNVKVTGGMVKIEWDRESNHIFMTGPARVTFTGEIDI